jgi:Mg-chelatase subunit ChlD
MDREAVQRWRLLLGRFAEAALPLGGPAPEALARERLLGQLYDREYEERGVRRAGSGASTFVVPEWIRGLEELFPHEVAEVITGHALDRYGLTELVTDPEVLGGLEPSYDLLKTVLSLRGSMEGPVLDVARRVVRQVVADLRERLASEVHDAVGRRHRRHLVTRRRSSRLHALRTIRANLRNYDPESRRLVVDDLLFESRQARRAPWHIIMAVDCSGSMLDSVIHSAVLAGIFAGLPTLSVRLLAFDTQVVDLSEHLEDPVEILMSVQLGGGTDICRAVEHSAALVEQPSRTVLVVVTDFYEGGDARRLVANIKALRGAGVRVLGLAALDQTCKPTYDRRLAAACVEAGAHVAALTPGRLAEWVAEAIG